MPLHPDLDLEYLSDQVVGNGSFRDVVGDQGAPMQHDDPVGKAHGQIEILQDGDNGGAIRKPPASRGTARLSFSLGRGGQVLASRLAGSSGHAALDGETLAMVRRAQPFPAFPPDIKQASMSFNVPIQFSIR